LLAATAAAGFWAGRGARQPPLQYTVPTATPPVPVTAYITGQVAEPGVYDLPPDARVIDLVVAAGGLLQGADHAAVNLAAKVSDGQRIVVPVARAALPPGTSGMPGQPTQSPMATEAGSDGGATSGQEAALPIDFPLNLNLATVADLDSLPRIGPSTAAAIVEWRDRNGGFKTVDDLLGVRGIGQATLDAIRPYVTAP
jgi:competence protein ComEA